ncbi:MAG TPA: glycosyltransferase [Acidimicrobiales bacterium]|nr:glycosyltransferase [Acidimicrobiales bacterium]
MTSESKLAPPVVAVLVTDGLGAWFEEALDAVREQDYGNLRVVVVDRGQHRVGEQVLSKIPEAVVREAASSKGFGEAANTVQSVVEGAAFYLFLREDAVLAPDAVTRLVDEALESNAGILGPKVLDWNDPTRLVSMGCLVDAFGVETPFVESGELDQQQHDRVREAFTVTGEAVLVRCDLFRTIGGFDPRITSGEQYLDLCWRAQIAGGRVLVVPNATVRAQSAMVETPPENLRRSQMRHRHHVMAKCYGWMHLVPIMVAAIVLSLLEVAYSLVTLRFSHARDVLAAWGWNLLHVRNVLSSRRQVAQIRETRDRVLRQRQAPGSTRLRGFLQGRIGGDIALQSISGRAGRRVSESFSAGPRRVALLAWTVIAVVLVFGSRHLLTQGVPVYGQFSTFPDTSSLLSGYWSGWREVGVGAAGIGPAALGLLGGLSWLSAGSMGLVREILILSPLLIGLVGMWRLLKPVDALWGRIIGTSLYAALPISYNALANGRWGTLLLFATAPFVICRVIKAFGVSPYDLAGTGMAHQMVSLGFLLGVVAAFEPLILVLALLASLAFVVTSIGAISPGAIARGFLIAFVALGVASLMHLPWVAVLGDSETVMRYLLVRSPSENSAELADLLRFSPGAYGNGWVTWCPMFVAVLPLLLGRGDRLRLAVMAGVVAFSGYGLSWASHRGWLTDLLGREVLVGEGSIVLAAVGVCWCAAVGPSSIKVDGDFSPAIVRRIAVSVGAASLIISSGVFLVESADGRWGAPTNDLRVSLSLLDDRDIGPSYRVLWLGDQDVLPLKGWAVGNEGLHVGTSVRGHPDIRHQWVGALTDGQSELLNAVEIGLSGNTTRMGRLLAPFGIRYVAVVERSTPSFSSGFDRPIGPRTRQALGSQLDLRPLATDPSVTVLVNESWMSSRAQFGSPVRLVGLDEPGELVVTDLTSGIPVLTDRRSSREQRGFVGAGEVLVAESFDPNWRLLVGGEVMFPEPSFGWAMRFESPIAGRAALWHIRPDSVADRAVVQAVLWAVVARLAVSERRKRRGVEVSV